MRRAEETGSPDPWAATAKIGSSAWAEGRVLGVVTEGISKLPVVWGMAGLLTTEVPVATVILVATAFGAWQTDLSGCRGTQGGRVLVAVWAAIAIRFISRRPAPSRSGGQRLKALAGATFPSFGISPSFSSPRWRSSPSPPPTVRAWRSGDGSCGAVARRVERGGGGCGVFLGPCRVCRRWPTALLEVVPRRGAVRACASWACFSYKPAVLFQWWLPRQCSLSPGARHLRACLRDKLLPFPGTPTPARLCQRVVSFPAGSECELQESVAAIVGCACFEGGCWFARAAVGFVLGLCIPVVVSQRLREP
ncbi:hypothetical protein Taro_000771, partial [Colocasia esculenta]|nr:hypothetical protein [Colocasia esculenta]